MILSRGDPEVYLKRHCFIDLYVFIISIFTYPYFIENVFFDKIFVLNNTAEHTAICSHLPDNNNRNENERDEIYPSGDLKYSDVTKLLNILIQLNIFFTICIAFVFGYNIFIFTYVCFD